MEKVEATDIMAISDLRAAFYRFLASIYKDELTQEQIEDVAAMAPGDFDGPLGEGLRLVSTSLASRNSGVRQRLAVDFARVFLGAGHYEKITAPPYESVFTSPERLLMQDARDDVVRFYRQAEFAVSSQAHMPEDHVSFEFQFMAELIDRMARAQRAGDQEAVQVAIALQQRFFRAHVANWIPAFCDAVEAHCSTDFYRGIASATRGFVVLEETWLSALAGDDSRGFE